MNRIILLILLLSCGAARAQYNNEWIDYNKTYYKFSVIKNTLHRISRASLQDIGLANVPAEQFQLWRNGVQIPLYTSVPSGALGSSDFIEFWGEMNDGKPDASLYVNINNQLNDKWSLETDTASYFLTVNPVGNNLRLTDQANNVAGNVLPAEPYFMYTTGTYFKNKINPGYAEIVGEYIYSSVYDKGEGWTSDDIGAGATLTSVQSQMYPYTSGPDATLLVTAAGNAVNNRTFTVKVNNTTLINVAMDAFTDQHQQATFPVSLISSGSASVAVTNVSGNPNDRMVVGKYEITYPRQFNFGSFSSFPFELPASNDGNYLRITFAYGAAPPVLYDLTNLKRYIGVTDEAGIAKFALLPSAQKRKLVLVSQVSSNIADITVFTTRNFVNYALPANQGDFIIISNQRLYNGANGNPVEAYAQYRRSAAGGGHTSRVYDIDQLTDQFAFGIKRHPSAVKKFLKYARSFFSTTPSNVFLIGKGVSYVQARSYESDPLLDQLNLIPPFGYPASDNLLASNDNETVSAIPTGRLSAVSPAEVEIYLEKVKEYESVGVNAPQTVAGRAWMKNIVHAIGGGNAQLSLEIGGYMSQLKNIAEDTLWGANVESFSKSSAVASQLTSDQLKRLFEDGIGIVNYFGHSSSTSTEFNIDDPSVYQNQGKYPLFLVNGCLAGDIFNFDQSRLSVPATLSEKYVLIKQKGAIGFVASTHYGIVSYLNSYLRGLYHAFGGKKYGSSIGKIMETAFASFLQASPGDYLARLHAEEVTLQGDPSITLYQQPLPDYIVEAPNVVIPPVITAADNSFKAAIKYYNIGKVTGDSIYVQVKRFYPDGSNKIILNSRVRAAHYSDSLSLDIPINPALEKGENKIEITIDAQNEQEEISETNNTVSKSFYIIENTATPVYPYKYSIISSGNLTFYASTADPLGGARQYIMEIDTTALFNSSLKKSVTIDARGGLLEFKPAMTFKDSTVYYWRVAPVPASNEDYVWSLSSFIYLPGSADGFNQSHYYQHLDSDEDGLRLSDDRKWSFSTVLNNLFIRNGVYPTASGFEASYVNGLNGQDILGAGCYYDELIFQVIDPNTFRPWKNDFSSGSQGLYGSMISTCGSKKTYNFEYLLSTPESRKKAMDFMDMIPDGAYVIVRTNSNPTPANNTFVDKWKADTSLYGSGNSLFHKLFNQGLTDLDSFYRPRAFSFVYKKNSIPAFSPQFKFGDDEYSLITMSVDCTSLDTVGYMTSPMLGPAKDWQTLHWDGLKLENPSNDHVSIEVEGVRNDGSSEQLFMVNEMQKDFDISSVNAAEFPYIKLRMKNVDTSNATPYQLKFWRINYTPYPEGAIAPAVFLQTRDTVDIGEKVDLGVAFKNVSDKDFDSLKVKFVLIDNSNVQHLLNVSKKKPLLSGDTIQVKYTFDTRNYNGLNTFMINFNPDYDQPEQYLLNNFLYKSIYVKPDTYNPLLDVTFDGVHILNNDIVSAKPHILIKLKDDSKFLLLEDTSLIKVQVVYPDGTVKSFSFNTDTLRFTPPSVSGGSSNDNTATIDFNPAFLEDGNYELRVTGRDASGNASGQSAYKVSFKIINKPMISNLFNYPNPFTTSTAFVFTLTGSEIPQNLRIQILTITGKIVREITREELGTIRIGRNITEFKWNGTDQYGQKLANGVYLYRVITNLNGKSLDKYKTEGDNTDQYFNKGYGKMYLMR